MTQYEDEKQGRKEAAEVAKQMLRAAYEARSAQEGESASREVDAVLLVRTLPTSTASANLDGKGPDVTPGFTPAPDLSDAHVVGFRDNERNDIRNFDDVARFMDTYQTNLNRLLGKMQDILIEAINHIEVLESHWQRLK